MGAGKTHGFAVEGTSIEDAEGGLTKVGRWLREDLGDSADHPRYIEVVPRVGIPFIAPVEKLEMALQWPSDGRVSGPRSSHPSPLRDLEARLEAAIQEPAEPGRHLELWESDPVP